MTLKTVAILFFTALLFSCAAHAGPREGRYQPHHGAHHHQYQRHHHKHGHKYKHMRRKHDHHYRAHYRGVAIAPVYVVPRLELGLRYGFAAGEAVIVYRSPYDY